MGAEEEIDKETCIKITFFPNFFVYFEEIVYLCRLLSA
jgi:hypothetical protein